MGVQSVRVLNNSTQNTLRRMSNAIWADCPWDQEFADGQRLLQFDDDFIMAGNATMSSAYAGSLGQWSVYGYAGATVTDAQLEGGVLQAQSDGDNEGLALLSSAGAFRLVTTSTLVLNGKLWFECSVAPSTIAATKHEAFVGLMTPSLSSGLPAAAIPISTTDDTLSTTPSLIGFHRKGTASPTDWSFVFQLAAGTANYPTGLTTLRATMSLPTLTAGTFTKLGFVFDPNWTTKAISSATARQTAGNVRKQLLRVFVNGLELPTFLSAEDVQNATATQAFPTGFMSPVFAVMNQTGTTPGYEEIDWLRVAQAPYSTSVA